MLPFFAPPEILHEAEADPSVACRFDILCLGMLLLELLCWETPLNDILTEYFGNGSVTAEKVGIFFEEAEWWRYSANLVLVLLDSLFIFQNEAPANML